MIASVCGIIAVMDPAMTEYHNNMDLLNQYMSEQRLTCLLYTSPSPRDRG